MLIAAEFQGDRLSDDEIISTAIMTLLAGNEPDVVMEIMRYVGPMHICSPGPKVRLPSCGRHLVTKMQLEEFFKALVQRFDGIELLDDRLDWHTSLAFRGLRSLNTRLIPTK